MKADSRLYQPLVLTVSAAAIFAVSTLFSGPAGSQGPPGYDRLQKGKETFMAECSKCHTLKYSLAETYSPDDWSLTVNMMVSNGAKLTDEQKGIIIDYLVAKTLFETKCSICHGVDRPLSKTKNHEQWKATATRMSGKRPGHLTAEEVETIAAFLALGYPNPKD